MKKELELIGKEHYTDVLVKFDFDPHAIFNKR